VIGRAGWVFAMALVALWPLAGSASAAAAPSTTRASVSSAGLEANAASGQRGVAISADGRYIVFVSDASNLVAGDGNGVADVFVRDTKLHTTERVSVSTAGVEGNGASGAEALAVSPGGRFVTFSSVATNLAPIVANPLCTPDPCPNIYIRDRLAHTTRVLVPFGTGLTPAHMVLSADARFYAYDTTVLDGVVRCRRSPRRCVHVAVLPRRIEIDKADANAYLGGMSAGGRFVLFRKIGFNESLHPASRLAGGVFVRDVLTHTTQVVTTNVHDQAGGLSPQGRFILFTSGSSTLVRGDTNRKRDVFVRDRSTGVIHRISVSSNGHQANGSSFGIAISTGGRYCLFSSTATNLVAGDDNGVRDLFLRDRRLGTTVRVDVSTSGSQSNRPVGARAALSTDGHWVVFGSPATNLVGGDTNAVRDVFIRGRLP
jgi:Tol biopolymer transport system component